MRITESELRRMIRSLMREAPLADFYPTVDAPMGSLDDRHRRRGWEGLPSKPGDVERLKQKFDHPNFSGRVRKLLQNFPVDVYVMPIAINESVTDTYYRLIIYDKSTFAKDIESGDEAPLLNQGEGTALMQKWALTAPSESCLICPISHSPGDKRAARTPWMIFHAMFDSGVDDERIFRACPSIKKFSKVIRAVIDTLLEEEEVFGLEDDENQRIENVKLLEKVFTFGSARANFFSRVEKGDFLDIENEALVQACVTTKGFTYSSDAVTKLPIDEKMRNDVEDLLAEAAALSSACKSELAGFMRGKIIIINL